ncbi:ABC transporter permease subunit [bacterium]|nr:ABC transporter permease subunit [bacterium]
MRFSFSHRILFLFLVVALYLPYIYLFKDFRWENIETGNLKEVFVLSMSQSFLSAIFSLLFGVWGSCGLFWLENRLSKKLYTLCEFLVLLPALLPAIFIVVSVLNVFPGFPFGLPGVVFLHVFSEVGMVSWVLKRLLSQKLSDLGDWALTTPTSARYFLYTAFPILRRDILQVLLILLFYFLTSFSIPLIVGSHSMAGMEVVIFEKVMLAQQWNQALTLFIYQSGFLVLLLFGILFFKPIPVEISGLRRLTLLEKSSGMLPLLVPPFIVLISAIFGSAKGLYQIQQQSDILTNWDVYVSGSLLVGFVTGGFVFILLSICTYFLQFRKTQLFFTSLVTPSFVILALACRPDNIWNDLLSPISLSWALCIAFLPAVVRLGLLQTVDHLSEQIEMAYFLGASPIEIFRRITWPQVLPSVSLLSGLAAIWAVGDFSLSRIILGSDQTLAMWVHSLVEHYRWSSAQLLSGLILLCGAVVFSFFAGVAYVSRQKLT